jgi:hypothetical protein
MKKGVGLIGSFLLGAAMVSAGLFSDLAAAQSLNGCGPSGGVPPKCNGSGSASVPEPASLLVIGAGIAGLAIWKRKSKND